MAKSKRPVERDGLYVIEGQPGEFFVATPTDANVFGFSLTASEVDFVFDFRRKHAKKAKANGVEPAFSELLSDYFLWAGPSALMDRGRWREWAETNLVFKH